MNAMMRINKIKHVSVFDRLKKLVSAALCLIITMLFCAQAVFADDIGSSKIATGTQKLITDATNWLMILAPAVAVLCIIYFLIRKSISDEIDHKKWNTRIAVALISCIGAVLAAVIVNVLVSYYK